MHLIRRILLIVLLIALAVLVFQNQEAFGQSVEFSFLSWSFSLVLGFWILFAFIAGVALFALVDAWRGMLLRLEIGRKNREIRELQERLIETTKGSNLDSNHSSAHRDSLGNDLHL
jgi:uncharacterized integral membrane protein